MRQSTYFTKKIDLSFSGFRRLKGMKIVLPFEGNRTREWEALDCASMPGLLVAGLTQERRIIVVRQWRPPVEHFTVELPGGGIEAEDVDVITAVKREFLQETGYVPEGEIKILTRCWAWNSRANHEIPIFFAQRCVKIQEPELDEVERLMELTVHEYGAAELMKNISEADTSSEFRDAFLSHALIALLSQGLVSL